MGSTRFQNESPCRAWFRSGKDSFLGQNLDASGRPVPPDRYSHPGACPDFCFLDAKGGQHFLPRVVPSDFRRISSSFFFWRGRGGGMEAIPCSLLFAYDVGVYPAPEFLFLEIQSSRIIESVGECVVRSSRTDHRKQQAIASPLIGSGNQIREH